MTEYGRGPGSEPWHPQDPLYGDGGWEGQQQAPASPPAYGGQQQYPQQPQQQYGDWGQGAQPGYEGHPQQPYPPQYDQQQYDQQRYDTQGVPPHPGHDQVYAAQAQQQYPQQGGWDATGTHGHVPYAADPGDPYGQQPAAYGAGQPDLYGTENAYPPPEPPGRRRPAAEPGPDPETGWDPGEDRGEHAFFAGDGDDPENPGGAEDPENAASNAGRGERRGRKPVKGRKRRTGCACLVVVLVFGGGLGGVGYFGYQYYQNRFGAAPDFAGTGTAQTVAVEIPKGAGGWEIGRRLKEAGVVKSADAFVHAQGTTKGGNGIEAGAYLLHKEMSAASAVELMLDPKSKKYVLVTPGERNAGVYAAIDKQLELGPGTTRKLAKDDYKSLGMPSWAERGGNIQDPLEGFLFPGTYPAAKGMKPEAVLQQMVSQAKARYKAYGLDRKAADFGLKNAFQLVVVASLVQAEGKTHDDFRKMAEVVYNRLKPTNTETNQHLQFDSTYNYLKGKSNIHISEKEINGDKSPYNTYTNKGLPPGPIGNPGEDALKATLNPTDDGWLYFVATDGTSNTEFAKTYDEFLRLKDKFDESSGN
ncbi:endolytic transglycosylase MltG [Streptomyces sp. J2-1]|uniref:endolytic transglycosylase MltG n=1 Tax=Streptomyces corallincola TaxID=2851888 RepID=UPI001C383B62|nr:endolytic transglycosylase MltG [Streptomyces corallincola]MBV2354491.1 endolytic transglycosylase MltG [Streptomyces corallincola]